MQITTRLVLLTLATMLPALAGAVWVIGQTYRTERLSVERNLRDTSRAYAMVIDRELGKRDAIARVLAMSRHLDNAPRLDEADLQGFQTDARQALDELEGWVILTRADGRVILPRTGSAGAPSEGAGAAPSSTSRDKGVVLPLPVGVPEGAEPSAIVRQVERGGKPVVSLAITVMPDELRRLTSPQSVPHGWTGTIVDGRGVIVTRYPEGDRWDGKPAAADLRARLAQRQEGSIDVRDDDGRRLVGYYSKNSYGWAYCLAVPRHVLLSNLRQTLIRIGLYSLVLVGLAVALAWRVGRRIAQPVQSLSVAARHLQQGLPLHPQSTGILECDRISQALAHASASILQSQADMQREVQRAVSNTRRAEQRASHGERVAALGRLTGGVAHDFNNLLGVISNSLHLLKHPNADADRDVPLHAIQRATEVGMRLTRHLLRFAGRQPTQPAFVHAGSFLRECADLLRTVLGTGIQVSSHVSDDTLGIRIDASELELALINLALNARDAMPAGGRFDIVARTPHASEADPLPPSGFVALLVSDTGCGIPPELRNRVFEPFFTTKPVGKGTGLGLSQVHGFCAQAGGLARIVDQPGAGTTVLMLLPAMAGSDGGDQAATGARDPAGGLRNLLLVEDNPALADVTRAVLGAYGYRVTHVPDADTALQRIEASAPAQFDVVLSDVVMPGNLDGLALARHLRAHQPQLPIVLISGYSSALRTDHDFIVLEKPCAPESVAAALDTAIATRRGAVGDVR